MPKKPEHEAVGYGRPPVDTRFKKGQSGNPRGRPSGSRNRRQMFEEAFWHEVTVSIGGEPKTMAAIEALLLATAQRSLSGSMKEAAALLRLAEQLDLFNEPEQS